MGLGWAASSMAPMASRDPILPGSTEGSGRASQALGQGPGRHFLKVAPDMVRQDQWPAGDHMAVGREPPCISARAFLVSHTVVDKAM